MQNKKLEIDISYLNLKRVACSLKRNKGFTLIEMLIVIAIIAGLATLVIPMIGGVSGNAANTIALNEMKNIKEAIKDRFYPDLGVIPEDTANPEYATRFLCLVPDDNKDINVTTGECSGSDDCIEMCEFLKVVFNNDYVKVKSYLHWDKYSRKGWQGPYLERDMIYDEDGLGTGTDYLPVVTDPWVKNIPHDKENPDNTDDDDEVLGEYRIIYDDLDGDPNKMTQEERLSVRIVSFGENGKDDGGGTKPLSSNTGDDLVMFIFGTGPTRSP